MHQTVSMFKTAIFCYYLVQWY